MKKLILLGFGILFLGAVLGAGTAYWKMRDVAVSEKRPAVESALESQNEKASGPVPTFLQEKAEVKSEVKKQTSPSVVVPKPKINVCEQAKKELSVALANADKNLVDALAVAKQVYDAEQQSASSALVDLARSRNDAVNSYLTAIALATSKYNSNKEPGAYEVYHQEQASALSIYTQKIADLNSQEAPLAEAKKISQNKYDTAKTSAEEQKTTAVTTANAQYIAKGCG